MNIEVCGVRLLVRTGPDEGMVWTCTLPPHSSSYEHAAVCFGGYHTWRDRRPQDQIKDADLDQAMWDRLEQLRAEGLTLITATNFLPQVLSAGRSRTVIYSYFSAWETKGFIRREGRSTWEILLPRARGYWHDLREDF